MDIHRSHGSPVDTGLLFEARDLGRIALKNRLAVSPMTRVSATEDGCATRQMAEYYAAFAEGGFGLVLTEGIYTDRAHSQGYHFQPGLTDREQVAAWAGVVSGVHAGGARIVAQLMHAGALSQGNPHSSRTIGPSSVRPRGAQMQFYRGNGRYPVPQAMTTEDITTVVQGFAQAARHARDAGFDGVEIHGANGYLLDQFLTEGVNVRQDGYGGNVRNRARLAFEVAQAVRDAVGPDFTVGIRISQGKVNDFLHKWSGEEEEAAIIFETIGALPLDYVHTTEFEAWKPAFATGSSLAALASRYSGLPVIANGSLHEPDTAYGMLSRGEADIVSLGRGALTHSDWPLRLRSGHAMQAFDRGMLSPLADLDNAERFRTLQKSA